MEIGTGFLPRPQWEADTAVQAVKAGKTEVNAQRVHQLGMAALEFGAFTLFRLLLLGAVQQEALIKRHAVFLQQLNIADHVQDCAVVVLHTVLDTDAVPGILQRLYFFAEHKLVRLKHRGGNHIEAAGQQLLLRFIAEDAQRRPVDA